MNTDQLGGIARAVLAAVGGIFVSKGYLDASTLQTIVGAVVTLGVAIWSIVSNKSGKTIGG